MWYRISRRRQVAIAVGSAVAVAAIATPMPASAAPHSASAGLAAVGRAWASWRAIPRAGASGRRVTDGSLSAVISRDRYGVPSIHSKTLAGMWFGSGWGQAQDRMVQLELTRRAVEGTLSQIFGPSELGQDETVRTFFCTQPELRAQFRSLPAATRRAIVEFSAGVNAYENHVFTSASAQQLIPVEFVVSARRSASPARTGQLRGGRSTPSPSETSWPGSSAAEAAVSCRTCPSSTT